jgi:hypothetical protein
MDETEFYCLCNMDEFDPHWFVFNFLSTSSTVDTKRTKSNESLSESDEPVWRLSVAKEIKRLINYEQE